MGVWCGVDNTVYIAGDCVVLGYEQRKNKAEQDQGVCFICDSDGSEFLVDICVLWFAFVGCRDDCAVDFVGCVGVDGVRIQTNQQRRILSGVAIYCMAVFRNVFEWNNCCSELEFQNFVFCIANVQVFQPHFGNVIGAVAF